VKELRYHPNPQARSLAGGKSQTLGMIVSHLENPFFLDVFRAFETDAISTIMRYWWPTPTTPRAGWFPAFN
jgi:DNA-binding LacI/PurR family transcriptional regulator